MGWLSDSCVLGQMCAENLCVSSRTWASFIRVALTRFRRLCCSRGRQQFHRVTQTACTALGPPPLTAVGSHWLSSSTSFRRACGATPADWDLSALMAVQHHYTLIKLDFVQHSFHGKEWDPITCGNDLSPLLILVFSRGTTDYVWDGFLLNSLA